MGSNLRSEASVIPLEIDDHYKRYRKEPWEVKYDQFGYCDLCNSRIDEFGYCACRGSAD
ncbi:hypothetical protein NTE_03530 [Candidatus Nitrososphaera evergladensis SR1]|uniref:Uncharacterized protein n=1 Tax=Candidatus Nitrososphaera evergladensis SR1 TaxID=1459636 RepID=A0A075MWR8_9ARCH|nr:hypothetical protein NTE_03530 [Candidatus Nitrososphaera evergladensis SR1]